MNDQRYTIRSGVADEPISVVIPTYNRAVLVKRAVESAIAALDVTDEIIVVDDGSTDGTETSLSSYSNRISIKRVPHGGAGAARNFGIGIAQHRWIGFLDSDDEWDRDKILLQRPLLRYSDDVAFIFSDFRVQINERVFHNYIRHWSNDHRPWTEIIGHGIQYSEVGVLPPGRQSFAIYKGSLYRKLLSTDYISAFTFLFRKDLCERTPTFATDTKTLEDWQFFAQVAQNGDGLYMDCETATQYGHSGPRLTDASELDRIDSKLRIMERVWGRDQTFLEYFGNEYQEERTKLQGRRNFLFGIKLALAGKMDEARAALAGADAIPWKHRLLFQLPDRAILALIACARVISN